MFSSFYLPLLLVLVALILRGVSALLTCPSLVTEPAAPTPVPRAPYDIRIEGLDARWIPNGRRVLFDVSLTIRAGSTVAVTGPSGSGKTTLAMVLLRFLDPAAGRVTLGSTDITTLASDDVRKIIGLCAQDAHIFDSGRTRPRRPGPAALVAPPPAACGSRQASKPPRPEQPLAAPPPTAGVTGSPGA